GTQSKRRKRRNAERRALDCGLGCTGPVECGGRVPIGSSLPGSKAPAALLLSARRAFGSGFPALWSVVGAACSCVPARAPSPRRSPEQRGLRFGPPRRLPVAQRRPRPVKPRPARGDLEHLPEDRKSTRLNSSHVKSSY